MVILIPFNVGTTHILYVVWCLGENDM